MADIGITEEGIVVAGTLQMTWDEIDAARNVFRFKNKVLVTMDFSYSRTDFTDARIYERNEWEKIKTNLDGISGYHFDFAGKHSEASISLDDVTIKEETDHSKIVEFFNLHGWGYEELNIIWAIKEQGLEEGLLDDDYNRIPDEED